MRVNKLKVKLGKRNKLNASRIAYFVTECYFPAAKKTGLKKKFMDSMYFLAKSTYFVNSVEAQIYTFAKKYSLACGEIPCEKPLAHRQPTRKIIPWSDKGFVIVELESKIEDFLKEVFKLEEK